MAAIFHRAMEIPLWAAVLFAVALGLPAGKPRWLVALFALALFASVLPATVRWARQSRLFAARRANLQPVDQRLGSAHRARGSAADGGAGICTDGHPIPRRAQGYARQE